MGRAALAPDRVDYVPIIDRPVIRWPNNARVGFWVDQISNEVRRIFELPDVRERLKNYDYLLAPTTPEELDRILRADIETFSEVVRLAGLRAK